MSFLLGHMASVSRSSARRVIVSSTSMLLRVTLRGSIVCPDPGTPSVFRPSHRAASASSGLLRPNPGTLRSTRYLPAIFACSSQHPSSLPLIFSIRTCQLGFFEETHLHTTPAGSSAQHASVTRQPRRRRRPSTNSVVAYQPTPLASSCSPVTDPATYASAPFDRRRPPVQCPETHLHQRPAASDPLYSVFVVVGATQSAVAPRRQSFASEISHSPAIPKTHQQRQPLAVAFSRRPVEASSFWGRRWSTGWGAPAVHEIWCTIRQFFWYSSSARYLVHPQQHIYLGTSSSATSSIDDINSGPHISPSVNDISSGPHISQLVSDISSGSHPTSVNQQWASPHICQSAVGLIPHPQLMTSAVDHIRQSANDINSGPHIRQSVDDISSEPHNQQQASSHIS
ncbi:hypothetical protein ACLOJK_029555 [Asimina triloba]